MKCSTCDSERVAFVSGKTSDRFFLEMPGVVDIDGYVPNDIGIGGNDYMEFNYCLDCGQIQGNWPVENPEED